ncbi:MAG: DNA-processing protein DprA [Bacteroidota bacterium]
MEETTLHYTIALTLIEGIGAVHAKQLIAYCGGAEAVFHEKASALRKIPGIGPKLASAVSGQQVLAQAEEELAFMNRNGITACTYLDASYPQLLKQCDDGPLVLFVKGNLPTTRGPVIAVVGTRQASGYGRACCQDLIQDLAPYGATIVSGLAYGIDICAHREAIKAQMPTIAVLAHGLDQLYPKAHQKAAREMQELGGLMTEFRSGTNPDREHFPRRNRIVAGMADAVVVIQSRKKGGAMITANIANSYHRDVFAFPGKVDDPLAQGCHHLIKTHRAALIGGAQDLVYAMGWEKQAAAPVEVPSAVATAALKPQEKVVVHAFANNQPVSVDQLCQDSGLPMNEVTAALLQLEFSGVVRSLPGKQYTLC